MPTKKRSQNTPKNKGYENFIRSLELFGLGLKSCTASLDRASFFDFGRKGSKAVRKMTEEYTLTEATDKHFDSEGKFTLVISEPSRKPALLIECVFQVHMHGAPPINKQFADQFTHSELRLILLPYFRHFVTTTMAQMSIPPLIIPLGTGQLPTGA